MKMANKKPEYDVYLPVWDQAEPWYEFAEEQRQTFIGSNPWRVSFVDKKQRVHAQASSCGAVVNVYRNAIEVGGPAGSSEMLIMGVFMILLSVAGVVMGAILLAETRLDLFSFFSLLMLIPSLYSLSFFTRLSFFKPRDIPVLFNRESRLVSVSKPRHISFFRFWEPGVVQDVVTYSWDCIHSRSYKYTQMMGETSREAYNLTLLCADLDHPHKFKDFTYLGYVETWEDAPLWRLWEHIRRYMEEDGPPLQPGEMLRTSGFGKLPKFPQHLIDAAGGEALSAEEIEKLTDYAQGLDE